MRFYLFSPPRRLDILAGFPYVLARVRRAAINRLSGLKAS